MRETPDGELPSASDQSQWGYDPVSVGFVEAQWMQTQGAQACVMDADLRCAVTGRGMLRITGSDAADFLHSQFSSDIRGLGTGCLRLTSYSDARGRLLAVMPVFADADGYLLELPADRLEAVAAQLRRFVLRARVTIEDVSTAWSAFGLAGPTVAAHLEQRLGGTPPAPATWAAVGDGARLANVGTGVPRWLVFGPGERLRDLWARFDELPAAPAQCWDLLEISAGVPSIQAPTAGRFVAQMVNLDCLDALDFRKGCYPGQEVIARTQHLGRIKRRMFPLRATSAERVPAPGEPVLEGAAGEPVGEIVRAAPHPEGGTLCLAVLRLAAADATLVLDDGTPAVRLDPPYPLDEAA